MKNIAEISGAVGTWPLISGSVCTSPFANDGLLLTAESWNDVWGFFQAAMYNVSASPSNIVDNGLSSQLLDAIKLLPQEYCININEGYYYPGSDWVYTEDYWYSDVANDVMYFQLQLPAMDNIIVSASVAIDPGGSETGTDRIGAIFEYKKYGGNWTETGSMYYDNGGASYQNLVTILTGTIYSDRAYRLKIKKANSTNQDNVYFLKIKKHK